MKEWLKYYTMHFINFQLQLCLIDFTVPILIVAVVNISQKFGDDEISFTEFN